MSTDQKKLQDLSDEYQKLQGGEFLVIPCWRFLFSQYSNIDLSTTVQARQKLESQQQENKNVQKEFSKLTDESNIYKLVGPVLLKQEKSEAVIAVEGRLQFIDKEMWWFSTMLWSSMVDSLKLQPTNREAN